MLLINPCDESEKFIPAVNECFLDLKKLAEQMAGESARAKSLKEFVYKLKCLEKELYLVSHKLKDTFKKNEHLHRELEAEKEKCRRKTSHIQDLEAQLASAEFKLKVRSNQNPPQRGKLTRDFGSQHGYRLESSTDLYNSIRKLRATTMESLKSIRNLIDASGKGDKSETTPATERDSPSERHDALEAIMNLKKENQERHEKISEQIRLLLDSDQIGAEANNARNVPNVPENNDEGAENNLSDACEEEGENIWNDTDFPFKVLESMKRSMEKLRTRSFALPDISPERMAAVIDAIEEHNSKLKEKLL